MIATREVGADHAPTIDSASYVLEHDRIPYISYPYEWPYSALRCAALHHLDLHLALLEYDLTLLDASAYNVQFRGTRPVFIDVLSATAYDEGGLWLGHRQFCEQFLIPLLLQRLLRVNFNAWLPWCSGGSGRVPVCASVTVVSAHLTADPLARRSTGETARGGGARPAGEPSPRRNEKAHPVAVVIDLDVERFSPLDRTAHATCRNRKQLG